MEIIAISQRVEHHLDYSEVRDSLDEAWTVLLENCESAPLLLPNCAEACQQLLHSIPVAGLILSGGNTLTKYGGDTPQREAAETAALTYALENHLPVLGVCHGMQLICEHFGGTLKVIQNHAGTKHKLKNSGQTVHSYHNFGILQLPEEFMVTEEAEDGEIEGIQHKNLPIYGVMYHPEREPGFLYDVLAPLHLKKRID